jgi:hypothetical protein
MVICTADTGSAAYRVPPAFLFLKSAFQQLIIGLPCVSLNHDQIPVPRSAHTQKDAILLPTLMVAVKAVWEAATILHIRWVVLLPQQITDVAWPRKGLLSYDVFLKPMAYVYIVELLHMYVYI